MSITQKMYAAQEKLTELRLQLLNLEMNRRANARKIQEIETKIRNIENSNQNG